MLKAPYPQLVCICSKKFNYSHPTNLDEHAKLKQSIKKKLATRKVIWLSIIHHERIQHFSSYRKLAPTEFFGFIYVKAKRSLNSSLLQKGSKLISKMVLKPWLFRYLSVPLPYR